MAYERLNLKTDDLLDEAVFKHIEDGIENAVYCADEATTSSDDGIHVDTVIAKGSDFSDPVTDSSFDFSVLNTRCYGFPGSLGGTSYIMTSAIPVEVGATYEVSTTCRFVTHSDAPSGVNNVNTLMHNTTIFVAQRDYCSITISASSSEVNSWTLKKVKNPIQTYQVVANGESYPEPVEYSSFNATIPNTRCYGFPGASSTSYIMTSAIPLQIGATYKLSTPARFVILSDTPANTSESSANINTNTQLDWVSTFTANKAFCSITISSSNANVNTWTLEKTQDGTTRTVPYETGYFIYDSNGTTQAASEYSYVRAYPIPEGTSKIVFQKEWNNLWLLDEIQRAVYCIVPFSFETASENASLYYSDSTLHTIPKNIKYIRGSFKTPATASVIDVHIPAYHYSPYTWVAEKTKTSDVRMNNIEQGISRVAKGIAQVENSIEEFKASIGELDVNYDAIAKSGWQGKKVGWIGDSLTAGKTWCQIVSNLFNFDASYLGVGGTTVTYESANSMSEMTRLNGMYDASVDENTGEAQPGGLVMPTDLDVLFFQGATNDWARNHPLGEKGQKFGYVTKTVDTTANMKVGGYSSITDGSLVTDNTSGKHSILIVPEKGYKYSIYKSDETTLHTNSNIITFDADYNALTESNTTGTVNVASNSDIEYIVIESTDPVGVDTTITPSSDSFVTGYLSNGSIVTTNTNYHTTDYIECRGGDTWSSTTSFRFINFFTSNKNFISAKENVSSGTIPDNAAYIRYTCAVTNTTSNIIFNDGGIVYVKSTSLSHQPITDNTYLYDACYQMYNNLLNYQTKDTFEVIALGTGYGQMPNRSQFGDNKFGLLNGLNLTTIDYGDVLVETAGEFGWGGVNIGREMGINHKNNALYIPDGLHFTTAASQKRAAKVVINYLLAHEPRQDSL